MQLRLGPQSHALIAVLGLPALLERVVHLRQGPRKRGKHRGSEIQFLRSDRMPAEHPQIDLIRHRRIPQLKLIAALVRRRSLLGKSIELGMRKQIVQSLRREELIRKLLHVKTENNCSNLGCFFVDHPAHLVAL